MEQRRNDIVSFVNENGSVTFAQIKERFAGVSEMTLRTDLKVLDQQTESFEFMVEQNHWIKLRKMMIS